MASTGVFVRPSSLSMSSAVVHGRILNSSLKIGWNWLRIGLKRLEKAGIGLNKLEYAGIGWTRLD